MKVTERKGNLEMCVVLIRMIMKKDMKKNRVQTEED